MGAILVLVILILLIVFLSNANKKNKMQMKQMAEKEFVVNYNDELLKLVTLKEKGAITEEEYTIEKSKLDANKGKVIISDLRTLNLAVERKEISQEEYLAHLKKYK